MIDKEDFNVCVLHNNTAFRIYRRGKLEEMWFCKELSINGVFLIRMIYILLGTWLVFTSNYELIPQGIFNFLCFLHTSLLPRLCCQAIEKPEEFRHNFSSRWYFIKSNYQAQEVLRCFIPNVILVQVKST